MRFLNEYEVAEAAQRFVGRPDLPNLDAATRSLVSLVDWTNANSDGWPYWQKPRKAAAKLVELVATVDRFDPVDCSPAELTAALRPVKAFRTRQGADFELVGP